MRMERYRERSVKDFFYEMTGSEPESIPGFFHDQNRDIPSGYRIFTIRFDSCIVKTEQIRAQWSPAYGLRRVGRMKRMDNAIRRRGTGKPIRLKKKDLFLSAIALPGFLYYMIFLYAPMFGLIIVFKDYNVFRGFLDSPWVGLKHFIRLFEEPIVFRAMLNTLTLGFMSILFSFPVPIVLAILIHEMKSRVYKRVIQTTTYLPHFLSMVTIVAMMSQYVFSPSGGIINIFLSKVLRMEPVYFLVKEEFFRPIYIFITIWKSAGWGSIIYLAALSNIDMNLYDAAKIDGAGKLRQIWHVTLPGLLPTIVVLLILNFGNVFGAQFELTFLLQNSFNRNVSEILETYVYNYGIASSSGLPKYSFTTAVGMFQSVVNLIMIVTVNSISRKVTQNSLW